MTPRICIVQPAASGVSETFLRHHADRLPGVVGVVEHQGITPTLAGRSVLATDPVSRLSRKFVRIVRRQPWKEEVDAAYRRAFRLLRPNVILAEYGIAGVAVLPACLMMRLPLVVQFHGFDASEFRVLEHYADRYRKLFRDASAIVAGCRSMADRLIDLGAPANRVVTNYVSTVDTAEFSAIDCGQNPPRFLAVGRFVEKKAPHLTILAFAKVARVVEAAELVMVGDGPLRNACMQLAVALGIADRVQFCGTSTSERVRQEMRLARAFVQHSVIAPSGDREGTSISVLEAAATGLAIIATRHEGIAETMVDRQTALLVDEFDVDDMAAQMLRVAQQPALAESLGSAAAKRVRENLTMSHSIDRLSRILAAAATGKPVDAVRAEIDRELADERQFVVSHKTDEGTRSERKRIGAAR